MVGDSCGGWQLCTFWQWRWNPFKTSTNISLVRGQIGTRLEWQENPIKNQNWKTRFNDVFTLHTLCGDLLLCRSLLIYNISQQWNLEAAILASSYRIEYLILLFLLVQFQHWEEMIIFFSSSNLPRVKVCEQICLHLSVPNAPGEWENLLVASFPTCDSSIYSVGHPLHPRSDSCLYRTVHELSSIRVELRRNRFGFHWASCSSCFP